MAKAIKIEGYRVSVVVAAISMVVVEAIATTDFVQEFRPARAAY